MSRETKVNLFYGTLAMGLVVVWINSMPLYGPLLVALQIKGPAYPIIHAEPCIKPEFTSSFSDAYQKQIIRVLKYS